MTRFIRLHPGAQKGDATNLGALSEPRREQNLYANPKRTAKSSSSVKSDPAHFNLFKKCSNFFRPIFPAPAPLSGRFQSRF
jgi:hypothetical protein